MSRLEEDEKNQADIRKRKFFAEILNSAREFQLQAQAILKRRKQRNDGIQVQITISLFLNFSVDETCCSNSKLVFLRIYYLVQFMQ